MSATTTRLEGLLEVVPDALVGMDQMGVIRFVNRQTEMLFGYDRDELIGRRIDTLVPEPLWQIYSEHRDDYFAHPMARSTGLDLELSGRLRDGSDFPINVSMSHIDTGDVLLGITASADVTRRLQGAQHAQRMTAIIEGSDDAIIGKTLDGIVTTWNPAAERMYGYSGREIIGRSIDLLSPKDRVSEITSLLARIRGGQPVERFETRRVRKDGTAFPVTLNVAPICDEDGSVAGAVSVTRDLTEQVQSDLACLRATLDSLLDPHVRYEAVRDASGQIVDFTCVEANPAASADLGLDRRDLVGRRMLGLFPGAAGARLVARCRQVVETGDPLALDDFSCTREAIDGQERFLDLSMGRVGAGLAQTWRDVTDRHVAAAALARSEERYRLLAESASDVVFRLSPTWCYEWISGSVGEVLGWRPADVLGRVVDDFLHPDDVARLRQAAAGGAPPGGAPPGAAPPGAARVELRFRSQDGAYRWVDCHFRVKVDEVGRPVAVVGGLVDVQDRKVSEERELARLDELEKFQRLAVGRELRMIELKREIERLSRYAPPCGSEHCGEHCGENCGQR